MDEQTIIPVNNHRFRQLDSLRGLAALTVFFGHFSGVILLPVYGKIMPMPLGILLNGNAAVMFFFLLSGFVLSLPFVNNNKPLKLTAFYVKRLFRLYPAFIFAIIFSLVLKQFLFDKNGMLPFSAWVKNFWTWDLNEDSFKQIARTLLLIGPQFKTTFIDAPIWSLVVEVKMSLLLPFFIMAVLRGNVVLNVLLLLVIVDLTYQHDAWALGIFYLGILLAKYKETIIQNISRWNMLILVFMLLLSVFLYNNFFEFLGQYRNLKIPYKDIWSDYLIAIGSAIFMMAVLDDQRISAFLSRPMFVFMGDMSYSFYLIHLPVLITVSSLISNRVSYNLICIFALSLIITIAVSYLAVMCLEKPFQRLALKLIKRHKILDAIKL